MNTADYLLERGETGDLALWIDGARHTYGDLRRAAARTVGALRRSGVSAGDRVALLGQNSLFWVAAYLALLKLEAVAVPLPATATPDDARQMVDLAGVSAVCADRRLLKRLGQALAPSRLVLDDVPADDLPGEWPAASTGFDGGQPAVLALTSGTTARPRAVVVTHHNLQANTESIIASLGLTSAERILVVLPFYYCFGASLLHTHLRVGGSVALCNTFTYPETALDVIEAAACTGLAGVPSTFQTLLRNSSFPRRHFPTLRKIQQAGGKLPEILIRELRSAAPGAQLFVMYGQTEATARLSCLPSELLDAKLGSVGRGIPGVTLQVLDEAGQPVKPGEVGEIVARGENICLGYLNEPAATAEKFTHGALRTGDLATVDQDGFIFILDRKSDFIKTSGYRVSSQQVEACALELQEVIGAAAIGVPDLARGEAIRLFVMLRPGSDLTEEAILAHCARRLARYMVPAEVVPLDRLPLNAHGKVAKGELRKWAAQEPA